MRQREHKRTRSVVGRQGDSIELMLGGNHNYRSRWSAMISAMRRRPTSLTIAMFRFGSRRLASSVAMYLVPR